jgi:phosphoglycerate dehydrogenase-like enzyme
VLAVEAPLPDHARRRLTALSPRVRLADGLAPATLQQAEVVFLGGRARIDPADAPRLRWVQYNSAGIGGLAGTPLARSDRPVANASGAYSSTVAELAIALLLALQRRLPRCLELQHARIWRGDMQRLRGHSCRGRTVGILGYGSIGREVARLAHAHGMNILACKRQPDRRSDPRFGLPGTGDPEGRLPQAWFGLAELPAMLARCDFLVVALPGGSQTEGLVNRAALAALPRHALVVNVGRGTVIDEPALREALHAGTIAGAGLDVFAEEPLPPSSPWWTTPNVLLTPHVASDTLEQAGLAAEVLIENVRRDLAGEPLLNVVDFALGY